MTTQSLYADGAVLDIAVGLYDEPIKELFIQMVRLRMYIELFVSLKF